MILDEGYLIIDGVKSESNLSVMKNAPYKISGELYAVWDIRLNSPYWDYIDVYCGILHEMFHCCQIEHNINDFHAIFTEGSALYVELLYKSSLKNKTIDELLRAYHEFVCKSHDDKILYYYIGAWILNFRIKHEKFSWEKYFENGVF